MLNLDVLDFNTNGRSVVLDENDEEHTVAIFNFNATQMGRGTISITYEDINDINSSDIMEDFMDFKDQIAEYIHNVDFHISNPA